MAENPTRAEILRAQLRIGSLALALQRASVTEWRFALPVIFDPQSMELWRAQLATELNTMALKNRLEERLAGIIQKEYARGLDWAEAEPGALARRRAVSIAREPLAGRSLRKWLSLTRKRAILDADKAVRFAIANADQPNEVSRAIRRTRSALRNNTRAITRMASAHAVSRGHEAAWKEAGAHSVQFTAIFDASTSSICQQVSGAIWPADSPEIQRPPLHPNCRSMLVPVYAEQPPPHFDYDEWLKRQPEDVQNNILGNNRASLYRSGRSLRSLIGQDGLYKPLSQT